MRKNNETRRGGNLGRVPERVCSAADTRKISFGQSQGQDFVRQAKVAPLRTGWRPNRSSGASTLTVELVPSQAGRAS
jgi:hypothetical protein